MSLRDTLDALDDMIGGIPTLAQQLAWLARHPVPPEPAAPPVNDEYRPLVWHAHGMTESQWYDSQTRMNMVSALGGVGGAIGRGFADGYSMARSAKLQQREAAQIGYEAWKLARDHAEAPAGRAVDNEAAIKAFQEQSERERQDRVHAEQLAFLRKLLDGQR